RPLRTSALRTRRRRRSLRLLVPVPARLPRGPALARAAAFRGGAGGARGRARTGRPRGAAIPPAPALVPRIAPRRGCPDPPAGPRRSVSRLERRRASGLARGGLPRQALGRRRDRRHRSGGLLRLPGDPPSRLARRRLDTADRLARNGLLPREAEPPRPRRRAV